MDEENIIDARGLYCPQPALLARQEMQTMEKGEIKVLVDNNTAKENVSRAARNLGWEINIDEQPEGSYLIVLKK